jgi:hypothetical protein
MTIGKDRIRTRVAVALGLAGALLGTTSTAGAQCRLPGSRIVGDFDGDGCGDIALTGGTTPGGSGTVWTTIPIAHHTFDGSFRVTNAPRRTSRGVRSIPPHAR